MANAGGGTRTRPIIRVFVSSTFSDLIHERNALQQRAWPELERRCQLRGFQFQAIDLRWGVSTEAGLDHRTMRICFEELRRSQEVSPEPNFLILLGNRYGWRPLPEAITVNQFQKLAAAATAIDSMPKRQRGPADTNPTRERAISSVSILTRWYRRDDNNLPPVYVLRSRIGTECEQDKQAWGKIEDALWEIVNRAYPPDSFTAERFQLPPMPEADRFGQPAFPEVVRFQASATEQEIWGGALSVAQPEQHVLACFRQIANLADFQTAEFDADAVRDFVSVTEHHIDKRLSDSHEQLKAEIRRRLKFNPTDSPLTSSCFTLDGAELRQSASNGSRTDQPASRWDIHLSDGYQANLNKLCDWVIARFTTIINGQIDAYLRDSNSAAAPSDQTLTQPSPQRALDIERQEHNRFANERGSATSFVGRNDERRRIREYVESESTSPLVIHGASGCGKTALLARAAQEIAELPICRDQKPIVRFIGATPRSSDLRALLTSLCQELRQRTASQATGEIPTDINELIQEFHSHFKTAKDDTPIILFLDALDQFSDADNGRQLHWLPFCRKSNPLPPHVRLVFSCLHEPTLKDRDHINQPHAAFKARQLSDASFIELKELTKTDAVDLLFKRRLLQANRTVNDDQRRLIEQRLESEPCRQPLYLKLLFEEVKLWRSYDEDVSLHEPDQPNEYVAALLMQLFDRLSLKVNHGKLLVERALGYIAAARRGLSETEILEVLFADDPGYKTELEAASKDNNHTLPIDPPRIPIAIWSRLRSDLAPYLTERAAPGGNVLTLYHRQVAEWIKARFVECSDWKPHERLATFFQRQQIWNDRKLDELPWQFAAAHQWRQLRETLTTLQCFLGLNKRNEHELLGYWLQLKPQFDLADSYTTAFARWSQGEPDTPELAVVAKHLAAFMHTAACYVKAEPLMRRALAINEQCFGAEHANVAADLANLAELLQTTNRLAEAEPLKRRALAICERIHGPNHPVVAIHLNNLGWLLKETHQLAEAEPLMRRALAIDEQNFGTEHHRVALRLNNLAQLLQETNRLAEAEVLIRRALAIDEQSFGLSHPNVARNLNTLSGLLCATNRPAEAEPLLNRAVVIDEQIFGPEHPNVALSLNNLATLLQATNRLAEAEPMMRRVLAIDEHRFGIENPVVANDLGHLATLLQETNRLAEAEPLMRRALAINEKSFGQRHPKVASDLHHLAALLQATNRLAEAEPLMRRALSIDERAFGEQHPTFARDLHGLAQILRATSRTVEAEKLTRRALHAFEVSLGNEHPDVADVLNTLASLLQDTNRIDEAEKLFCRALSIHEHSFSNDHPRIARALNNLALLLQSTNRQAEAEPLIRRALSIDEKCFGPHHPEVATDLNNLALLLQSTNRQPEAEPLFRRALSIDERSYGPHHPEVATDLFNLAVCIGSRLDEAELLMQRAVRIFFHFSRKTKHPHPHEHVSLSYYEQLLRAMRLSESDVRRQLNDLRAEYGMPMS